MPLKPILDRSPLMTLKSAPLRPGQSRVQLSPMQALYAMTANAQKQPLLWEGAFRLACQLTAKPMEEPVARWVQDAMAAQLPEGALTASLPASIAVLRAAWAMYEYTGQRDLLERMMKWCGWACDHWEELLAQRDIRVRPADLMELLSSLYRCTGVKPLLTLCERLRAQGMDWSGALHTFSVQQALRRMTTWQEQEKGMLAEAHSETGFYTRQYLICHGETLADGMRSATISGRYSGSGSELSAAKIGWERISRYHGAVCGGFTSDETLGGTSPSCAVGAPALGALAEALAVQDEAWAYEALEEMLTNALPAAIHQNDLVVFQRVNSLREDCGTQDCWHVEEDAYERALQRLSRGYAAAVSSAVTCYPDGLMVNMLLPGRYAVPIKEQMLVLDVTGNGGQYIITVHGKQPVRTSVHLRVPSWVKEISIAINGLQVDDNCEHMCIDLDRTWNEGDVIRVDMVRSLRVVEGYHQSACIKYGSQVMAWPVTDSEGWQVALCGSPEVNDLGMVTAELRRVPQWRRKGAVPVDMPVRPATEGECIHAVLAPYASTPCRIALFPRGKQA